MGLVPAEVVARADIDEADSDVAGPGRDHGPQQRGAGGGAGQEGAAGGKQFRHLSLQESHAGPAGDYALLGHLNRPPRQGYRAMLISPPVFRYSGLATGVLSGALEPGAGEIDVAGLASAFGVAFHPSEVAAIDRGGRSVTLLDGATLTYDVLSLNVGSRTADPLELAAQ
eukprot:gene50905-69244_t